MFVVRIQTVVVCDVTHYRSVDRYGTVWYGSNVSVEPTLSILCHYRCC